MSAASKLSPAVRAKMLRGLLRPLAPDDARTVLRELSCFLRVVRGASEAHGFSNAHRRDLSEGDVAALSAAGTELCAHAAVALSYHPLNDVIGAALVALTGRSLHENAADVGLWSYDTERDILRGCRRAIARARRAVKP